MHGQIIMYILYCYIELHHYSLRSNHVDNSILYLLSIIYIIYMLYFDGYLLNSLTSLEQIAMP